MSLVPETVPTPSKVATPDSYGTLLFRKEGLRVAIVKDGKPELIPVTPGRDFGDSLEIVSGLRGDESVIVNPPDSITTGEKVQIAQTAAIGGTP